MAFDGMLPEGAKCKKCGKLLNADGGHPAELFLGTYTGLCYSCERSGPYTVGVFKLDGAVKISYPPHSPAWSREREEYTGYPDCPDCQGSGRRYVSRPLYRGGSYYSYGGSYYSYCRRCHETFWDHPRRKRHSRTANRLYEELGRLREKLDKEFQEALPVELRLPREEVPEEKRAAWDEVAGPFIKQFKQAQARRMAEIAVEFGDAYEYEYKEEQNDRTLQDETGR